MASVVSAMLLSLGQLGDPRVVRLLGKTVAATLALFALLGAAGWYALDWALGRAGLADTLFAGAGGVREIASLVLVVLGGWLLWRVIAMAVISFFADEIVLAVEARHYPDEAARARDLSIPEQARSSLGAAGRALLANLIALPFALALLVTGIGTALLFWLVNAVLIGRELRDMVWLRHRHAAGEASPMGAWQRFLLGGAIAALLLVPFANFVAPLIGAASATHLTHGRRSPRIA